MQNPEKITQQEQKIYILWNILKTLYKNTISNEDILVMIEEVPVEEEKYDAKTWARKTSRNGNFGYFNNQKPKYMQNQKEVQPSSKTGTKITNSPIKTLSVKSNYMLGYCWEKTSKGKSKFKIPL